MMVQAKQSRKSLTLLEVVPFTQLQVHGVLVYSAANTDYTVTVAGGGSGAGASKVCSTDSDSVHIGDMSRDWKSSEATPG